MTRSHPSLVSGSPEVAFSKNLSVVVPSFNESENVLPFLAKLVPVMTGIGLPFEVIFVDDGSRDDTANKVLSARALYPMVKLVRFSRNFGKEAALNAGLAHAAGDAVIQIDADLQHPPEVIIDFVREWQAGGEIVYGARRTRDDDGMLRRFLTRSFYRVFSVVSNIKLMEGLGDFLLLDRKVVAAILSLSERERFTKGLYAWVGYHRVPVPFDVAPRQYGQSAWSLFRLFHFAIDAITSFGTLPLKVWTYIGLLLSVASLSYALFIVLERLLFGTDVPGYPSLMAGICFFAGVQLLGLGIVGEYLSRVLAEVKQRPLYLVQQRFGFDETQGAESGPHLEQKPAKRIAS
ncbi:MAG: glycosyltransferase family 2 protein [Rhizobiales bacterium]|nr:glycosyltransferase family 2 protein [Hyphomicrobiales bacterium]